MLCSLHCARNEPNWVRMTFISLDNAAMMMSFCMANLILCHGRHLLVRAGTEGMNKINAVILTKLRCQQRASCGLQDR